MQYAGFLQNKTGSHYSHRSCQTKKFKSGCQAPKKATAGIEPAIWVEPVRKITQIRQNRRHISCKNLIQDIHVKIPHTQGYVACNTNRS